MGRIFVRGDPCGTHFCKGRPLWDAFSYDRFGPLHGSEEVSSPFATIGTGSFMMYRMLLGNIDLQYFDDNFELAIWALFEFVVVIIMLNVLIAVVSDSYDFSLLRAQSAFLNTVVEVVVELETMGLTEPTNKTVYGRINLAVRRGNRILNERVWELLKTLHLVRYTDIDEEDPEIEATFLSEHSAKRRAQLEIGDDAEMDEQKAMLDTGLLGLLQRWLVMSEDDDVWAGRILETERRTARVLGNQLDHSQEETRLWREELQHELTELKLLMENLFVRS